jgi:hypothetical protein
MVRNLQSTVFLAATLLAVGSVWASPKDMPNRPEVAAHQQTAVHGPLVSRWPIVYVVRHQYAADHHNTATLFQIGEINSQKFSGGSAIRTIDLQKGGRVRTLLEVPEGVVRDLDVSFDGKRVLFAMRRRADDDYHIYEMHADGSKLRQLTFGSGVSDIDPIYVPERKIVFSSTREPKYCMCNRHIMCNLFAMEGDGANIQQIGHSTLFEGHPSLLPDGRILYDRWEYVDRNFGDAQGAWTCHPDGTNHALYWGNNTNSPGAVLDNRAIPGTELLICTFSSCHDRPWGALAIVDPRRGLDGREPVLRTWPADATKLVGRGNYDTFKQVQPKYEDPYPLNERHFLCARTVGQGEQMGIFLLGLDGSETLLHTESPGCFDPMPLGPRPMPQAVVSRVDLAKESGSFYVANVYAGTGMETVPRGTVKYLRVVESPEKRFWTDPAWDGGTGQQAPGMAWDDFNNKRILGTAPVEEDGSAYFEVPADRFVYFQLLDEKRMMVQSMRSGTIIRPGETIGCIGCHDNRRQTSPLGHLPLAMQRGPSQLEPWYGPPRNFGYLAEVQPVWDKHCVRCHDAGEEAGAKLNLAGDLGLIFNMSYVELRSKKYVTVVGAGPFQMLPPKSWGSHASRLTQVLLEGHGDPQIDRQVKLNEESIERVITWIDINAPYYPEYASAYRKNRFGRAPLTDTQLAKLQQLTGSTEVNFTHPERSRCLETLTTHSDTTGTVTLPQKGRADDHVLSYAPKDHTTIDRQKALAIIRAGQQMLVHRPRADMPGFHLVSETERRQQAKYDALRAALTRIKARSTVVPKLLRNNELPDCLPEIPEPQGARRSFSGVYCHAAPEASEKPPSPWAALHTIEREAPAAEESPGNIFTAGDDVAVRVPKDLPPQAARWQVLDDTGTVIATETLKESEPAASRIAVGKLGIGWYRVEFLAADGSCAAWTTAAVLAKRTVPVRQDSPICIDSATAWFARNDPADQQRYARLAALAGANWIRDRLRWQDIEVAPDRYAAQGTTYDTAATIQSRCGLKVLQVFHDTPPWAAENGALTGRFPPDLRAVYRFGKTMAVRLKGRVQAWEPWNEANCPPFGGHTVVEMCSYQKAAYLGLKAGDPDVSVGMNVATGVPTTLHADIVLANETWPFFDTYNFHTYERPDLYPGLWGPIRKAASGRPIWITESDRGLKYVTGPPWYEQSRKGEILKAHFIAQSYASGLFAGANRYFHFVLGHYTEANNKTQFGLLRLDKTPRPAYVALAASGRLLDGARCLGRWRLPNSPNAYAYAFRAFPDGQASDVLVAWSERPVEWPERGKLRVAWSLPAQLTVKAVYDYLGRPQGTQAPAVLQSAPVFVVLPAGGTDSLSLDKYIRAPYRAGRASPVVLQLSVPKTATQQIKVKPWALEYDYVVPPDEEIELPLFIYNFGDAAVQGVVKAAHVPTGWQFSPKQWDLHLDPMERTKLSVRCKRPPGKKGDATADTWIELRGDFGDAGRPVLVFRLPTFPGEGYEKRPASL